MSKRIKRAALLATARGHSVEGPTKRLVYPKKTQVLAKSRVKTVASNSLEFSVEIQGTEYPFVFTHEQLNEAYGKAIASVFSEMEKGNVLVFEKK